MKKYILSFLIILSIFSLVGCGTKEIDNSELDESVKINDTLNLTGSQYEVNKDNIDIKLIYSGDILKVGIITQIRNIVETELKDKYKKIDLTIIQEDPFESVNYIFENGKWDKDIE